MDAFVDLMLSKVMKDLGRPLTENIDRFHMMGYINVFELVGEKLFCVESRLGVPVTDIFVDEVYEYTDDEGPLPRVFLFAIHELKYRRKGIFIAREGDTPLNDRYQVRSNS